MPAEITTGQLHGQAWTRILAGEKPLGQKPCLGSRQIHLRAEVLERGIILGKAGRGSKGLDLLKEPGKIWKDQCSGSFRHGQQHGLFTLARQG